MDVSKVKAYSRLKYFRRYVEDVVGYQYADIITHDFTKAVRVMIDNNVIKGKNISKYGYHIIQLASRRGIPVVTNPSDLKPGKTKQIFDDRLFGQVYRLLDCDCDSLTLNCPYYLKWRDGMGIMKYLCR